MEQHGIGDFSRMSGLPVKTLRFYHEKGILIPASVDPESGYRRYDRRNLDTALVIVALRRLDFGLEAITEILAGHEDDADILEFLEAQADRMRGEIKHRRDIVRTLSSIIAQEAQARTLMSDGTDDIEEKTLAPTLIAGIRTKGRYSDCGKLFGQLGRKVGRHVGGKALMLCHDDEYREEDADYEVCFPLKRTVTKEGVDTREIPGGRALCLLHRGPYDQLHRSYGRLLDHAKERGLRVRKPSREIYLKGPGMIFKGNPAKYLTEVQFLLDRQATP